MFEAKFSSKIHVMDVLGCIIFDVSGVSKHFESFNIRSLPSVDPAMADQVPAYIPVATNPQMVFSVAIVMALLHL